MITKSIPSLFTVGNLFLGIMAILFSIQSVQHIESNYLNYAAVLVIIGTLLDGLDGRMARILNAASEFGKELDSLSDIVTFGVAPAVILYLVILQDYGMWGIILTALFPICGSLRLARFSVTPGTPGFFTGLPITAAGGVLALLALYQVYLHEAILIGGVLALSLLMISNIQYPSFKKVGVSRATFWVTPIVIGIVAILAFRYPSELPFLVLIPLCLYSLYGMKRSLDRILRKKRATYKERRSRT
jgi:CDP-diacylglycerol--serine O-phosphatidyltransferase